jgi:hypothetical protein
MHYDNNSRRSQLLWSRQQTRLVGDTLRSDKPVCSHTGVANVINMKCS